MRTKPIWLGGICFLLASVGSAQAPELSPHELQRAKAAFVKATTAYSDGEFEVALTGFQTAYEITRNPDLLYNIATVADRMRKDELALSSYEAYLRARPMSSDRENVEGRIRSLRSTIAIRVAQKKRAEAQAAAKAAEAAERAALAERQRLKDVEMVYVPPGKGPWLVVGGGAALLGGGVAMLILARNDKNTVEDPVPFTPFENVRRENDRAKRRAVAGGVLSVLGVSTAVAGVIWHFRGGERIPETELLVGPAGVHIRGRF